MMKSKFDRFIEELFDLCNEYPDDGRPMSIGTREVLHSQFIGKLGNLALKYKLEFKRVEKNSDFL